MVTERIDPVAVLTPVVVGPRPGRIASDRAGSVGLDTSDVVLPWILGIATLIARLATAASGPTDWDSTQYAAAVARFDVTHGRPQPPGYFLYVVAGRLVHATGIGVIDSLILIAAVASAVAVGLVVVAGRDLGGRWVGLAAGLIVATSPFVWFSGSIVSTYSFDLMVAPLLIILAWRARPHTWHGAGALVTLALAAGFRQSALQAFALLALVAVVGSVRRVRQGVVAVAAGAVAFGAWFVPMALSQPGGLPAWIRATRIEVQGAAHATSIFSTASGGATNLGTFAGYTTLALAPLVVLALLAGCILAIRALSGAITERPKHQDGPVHRHSGDDPSWIRPWFQSRTVILLAAIAPPMPLVALLEFAKSGYLLAYLPGAVIALLLVPGAVIGTRASSDQRRSGSTSGAWLALASLSVVAIAVAGADRFLHASGVLPVAATQTDNGLWITQARYQAPYPATWSDIRSMDAINVALAGLAPRVRSDRDVVVIDSVDGGDTFYRNAGWALPLDRVALVVPGAAIYNQQHGSLYYTQRRTVPVGPGGSVYLIAPPSLPGLAQAAQAGHVALVPLTPTIAAYRVWRISPGASILGVRVVASDGPRPLGSGLGS